MTDVDVSYWSRKDTLCAYRVVDRQIVIAEPFGGLRIILDGLWIVTEFCLGKHDPILHGEPSWCISR